MRTRKSMILALLLGLLPLAALADESGGEFAVSTSPKGDKSRPVASMDARGEVLVVWLTDSSVQGRRFDLNGKPRGNDFQVGTKEGTYLGPVSASQDVRGFSVVWGNEDARSSRPSLVRFFDDQGRAVTGQTPFLPEVPVVARDGRGNSVVLGSFGGILGQRFDAAGRKVGRAFWVTGNPVSSSISRVRVAMDATGSFVVVWGNGSRIFGRRFNAVAKPLGPTFLVSKNDGEKDLAGNAKGSFVVAWNTDQAVFARLFSPSGAQGGTLRRPIRVSSGGPVSGASVAMDADGRFLVTWSSGFETIFGRFFEASGAAHGAEFQVSAGGTGLNRGPSATAGPSGDFLVVWGRDSISGAVGDIIGRWLTLP